LVEMGLLRRHQYQTHPAREEYRLTPLGKDLYGHVLASWRWDRRWGDPHHLMPKKLLHRRCGHTCTPQLLCPHCAAPLSLPNMQPELLAGASPLPLRTERNRRWRKPQPAGGPALGRDILAVIDDRWSLLLVAASMLGLTRYDEYVQALAISSAVLAQRLQRLCLLDVLRRQPDPDDARRASYRLAPAGTALFPYLLTLSAWGQALASGPDTIAWRHRSCGQSTPGTVACSHCRETLLPHDVVRPASPKSAKVTG
jgi:DNA-binding HxlR family transcriptional regulator